MPRHIIAFACLLAAWLLCPNAAHAVDDQVVILRVGDVTPSMQEAVARMQGELAAAGFTSLLLDTQATTNVVDEIDAINRVVKPAATFALQAQSGVAEVWFSDRRTGQHVSQLIDLAHEPPSRVPLVLAVRAAEFLRGHLTPAPARSSPPPPPKREAPIQTAQPSRWSLGVGALLLSELEPQAASVSPSARFGYLLWQRVSLDFLLAGFGTDIDVKGSQGAAKVSRQLGALGGRFHPRGSGAALDAFVGVAMTAHHLSGRGTANPGFAGTDRAAWAGGFMAELGIRLRLNAWLWAELAAAAGAMLPKVRVRFDNEAQQQFGALSLQTGLSVGVNL